MGLIVPAKEEVSELRVRSGDWDRIDALECKFKRQTPRAVPREGEGRTRFARIHANQRVSYSVKGRIPAQDDPPKPV